MYFYTKDNRVFVDDNFIPKNTIGGKYYESDTKIEIYDNRSRKHYFKGLITDLVKESDVAYADKADLEAALPNFFFDPTIIYDYEAYSEYGDMVSYVSTFKNIEGWDKKSIPVLFFKALNIGSVYLYAYQTIDDRLYNLNPVFRILFNNSVIEELNSSGYGGSLRFIQGFDGDTMYCRAKKTVYLETNEVGTSADTVSDYKNILIWNRIAKNVLFFYYEGFDVGGSGEAGFEIYDNVTSRNNRTALDLLATIIIDDPEIQEANSSGFGGTLTFSDFSIDGDKFYLTTL